MTHAPLRLGMVGGGRDAFIGAVHRRAAALDSRFVLVAGALSSNPDKALASGRDLGLPRVYPTWQAMLEAERARPRSDSSIGERSTTAESDRGRIDAVAIVTPNHEHHPIARAFAEAGFHVICDKPLCLDSAQADDLIRVTDRAGIVFAVTYNYTGYPMIKQARAMVRRGDLGTIRKIVVEYNQGWLATALERTGQKQADWRTDPARSGVGGAIGDIGSHAENLLATVTGLHIRAVCADLARFIPGRRLDDDANVLLRLARPGSPPDDPEPRGVLIASQIEIGHENDLRLRVHGDKGSLDWHQESPDTLWFRPLAGPVQMLRRGNAYLNDDAKAATRLPAGHPEAFIEAFANVYAAAADAIVGHQPRAGASRIAPDTAADFPTVRDGARGIRFIEAVVRSADSSAKWTPVD
ncbi:MAG: Gfo/Idh/MocA family protein [Phycisphaerales bacterium]